MSNYNYCPHLESQVENEINNKIGKMYAIDLQDLLDHGIVYDELVEYAMDRTEWHEDLARDIVESQFEHAEFYLQQGV